MSKLEMLPPSSVITTLFEAVDEGDLDTVGSFLADDVQVFFGNTGPYVGRKSFCDLYSQFMGTISSVRHEHHDLWRVREEETVFIARMTVHYETRSGNLHSLPCCNVFRFSGNLVSEYRVYMDITPIFSDSTSGSSGMP